MIEDLYCKVYLEGASDVPSLKSLVATLSGGEVQGRTVRTSDLVIDIFENREASASAGGDFVRWPFYLEIEAVNELPFDGFLVALASLLTELPNNGVRAVPSCDFESELKAAMG